MPFPNYNCMNIIALFEKLQLDKASVSVISVEEIIRLEKSINAEIDTKAASDLTEAFHHYREELAFVVGNRTLYNFLSDKNYSRNTFQFPVPEVNAERIRSFFRRFLEDDLVLIAERDLADDNFFNLVSVCSHKEYISESILTGIRKSLLDKLEESCNALRNGAVSGNSENRLVNREFYELLGCFSDPLTDGKVTGLINIVTKTHNKATPENSMLTRDIMIAMSEYRPFDALLTNVINRNKEVMTKAAINTGKSSDYSFPWWKMLLFAIVAIRIIIAIIKSSSTSAENALPDDAAPVYEDYRTKDYKTTAVDPTYFFNYLTNYDKSELEIDFTTVYIPNEGIPFHGMYDGMIPSSGKSPVEFTNNTRYDLILMIEGTNDIRSSEYIQAGEKAAVNIGGRHFRFYFGNRLASFGTENSTYQRRNANNTRKVQEYRFAELPENCRLMLDKQFDINSDVLITQSGESVSIESEGIRCLTDSRGVKDGKYVFDTE